MKKQLLMIKHSISLLGLAIFGLALINTAQAAKVKNLKCSTPNEERTFTVGATKVTFHKKDAFKTNRAISSTPVAVRTLKTHQGFTKILYVSGHKHRIHINNINSMNDVDDYISIISPRGHKMTYPINCKLL